MGRIVRVYGGGTSQCGRSNLVDRQRWSKQIRKKLEYSSGGDDLGINESLRVEDVCIQTIGTPLSINSHTVVPK